MKPEQAALLMSPIAPSAHGGRGTVRADRHRSVPWPIGVGSSSGASPMHSAACSTPPSPCSRASRRWRAPGPWSRRPMARAFPGAPRRRPCRRRRSTERASAGPMSCASPNRPSRRTAVSWPVYTPRRARPTDASTPPAPTGARMSRTCRVSRHSTWAPLHRRSAARSRPANRSSSRSTPSSSTSRAPKPSASRRSTASPA